jgi:UrcA family protein
VLDFIRNQHVSKVLDIYSDPISLMNTLIKPFTLIVALSVPALASAEINSRQIAETEVRITFDSADTRTNYGRIELERQVRRAAKKVCGEQQPLRSGSFSQSTVNRVCVKETVEATLRKLNLDD